MIAAVPVSAPVFRKHSHCFLKSAGHSLEVYVDDLSCFSDIPTFLHHQSINSSQLTLARRRSSNKNVFRDAVRDKDTFSGELPVPPSERPHPFPFFTKKGPTEFFPPPADASLVPGESWFPS